MQDRMVDASWQRIILPRGRGVKFISPPTTDAATGVQTTFIKSVRNFVSAGAPEQMRTFTRKDVHPLHAITRALETTAIAGAPHLQSAGFVYHPRASLLAELTLQPTHEPSQITLALSPEQNESDFWAVYSSRRGTLQKFHTLIPPSSQASTADHAIGLYELADTDPNEAMQQLCIYYQDHGPLIFYPFDINDDSANDPAVIAREQQLRRKELAVKFQRWEKGLQDKVYSKAKKVCLSFINNKLDRKNAAVFSDHFALLVLKLIDPSFDLKSASEQDDSFLETFVAAVTTTLQIRDANLEMLGNHETELVKQRGKSISFTDCETKKCVRENAGTFIEPFTYSVAREHGGLRFHLAHFRKSRPSISILLPETIDVRTILPMADEDNIDWLKLPQLLQPLDYQEVLPSTS